VKEEPQKKRWKTLKITSDELKKLPDDVNFELGIGDLMSSDILKEVYEKEILDLKIEYKNLEAYLLSERKYPIESINADLLRSIVKQFSKQDYCLGSCRLNYSTHPNIIQNDEFDFSDFFRGLARIEKNLNEIKEFEALIDSFDTKILKDIDKNIQDILELLSSALREKVYNLKFDRNMKPSEIEFIIYGITNYAPILEKAKYLSTDVALRVDRVRSRLFELFFTK
jgi:hypothetical protein